MRISDWSSDVCSSDLRDAGHHLGRIGHLRDPFRRNEAAELDRRKTGGGQTVDQRNLDRRRYGLRLVLQPVARADLDDTHAPRQFRRHSPCLASITITSAPSSTWSPARARTAATSPDRKSTRLNSSAHKSELQSQ